MTTEDSIKDWFRMYKTLTDPELKEVAKRTTERKERLEAKKADTGV